MKEMLQYEDCVFEYVLPHSAPTSPRRKYSTPTGPPCGPDCLLTERQCK
jgi:hypothetical protein